MDERCIICPGDNCQSLNCPSQTECFTANYIRVGGDAFYVIFDGPSDDGLTWLYKVNKMGVKDLKQFNIQIFPGVNVQSIKWEIRALVNGIQCADLLASGTGPDGQHFFYNPNGIAGSCTEGTPVITFDNLNFPTGCPPCPTKFEDFCFKITLDQCLVPSCVCLGLAAADRSTLVYSSCACFQGPSATGESCGPPPPPPPTRGIPIF